MHACMVVLILRTTYPFVGCKRTRRIGGFALYSPYFVAWEGRQFSRHANCYRHFFLIPPCPIRSLQVLSLQSFLLCSPLYALTLHVCCAAFDPLSNSATIDAQSDEILSSIVWPKGSCYFLVRLESTRPISPLERRTTWNSSFPVKWSLHVWIGHMCNA